MCGIVGWVDGEMDLTRESATLEAMTGTLTCRGPDDYGMWLSRRAGLGHRRLIVIDPAGGGQPMRRRRGERDVILLYNGELYNTDELRQELAGRGHTFKGHADTEVLLLAYLEWGPSCVERLNGIFAFAIWDDADQRLVMGRDRIGVKPLFYAPRGKGLIFGSELKAILAHPAVHPEVTSEGLAEIFAIGPARTPGHGIFRDVFELKPGHLLTWTRQGMHTHPYWCLQSRPHEDDLDTTIATVRELFRDTVERQLVSDVPIGTLLSGGLDSSAITGVAARAFERTGRGPLHTFSIDYEGNDRHFKADDFQPGADAPWAKRVSDQFGTVHHTFSIRTPELVEALKTAVRARDLPGMADIDASLYLFCRAIKEDVTVAVSGECADEVFGGYPWFHRAEALGARTFPWSLRLADRIQLLSPELVRHVKPGAYAADRYSEALAEVPRLPGEEPEAARMREMFYLNLTRWMPTLLDRKDRMSMAVGLEVRVPFCDHRLVEYVWNVPWSMKNYGSREKGLLRRALVGLLPDDVLWRRKSPFPKTFHPAYLQATRRWLLDILDDPSSPLRPLVDVESVRRLARSEGEFDIPWFGQLMRLPQLFAYLGQVDTWLREYRVSVV